MVASGAGDGHSYHVSDYLVSDMRSIFGYALIIVTTAISLALVKFKPSSTQSEMVMFCIKCKKAENYTFYKVNNTQSGRLVAQSKCATCGTKVNRILKDA